KMVDNLVSALRDRINGLDWMSAPTKKEAVTKLNAYMRKVAYPDTWRSYAGLTVKRGQYAAGRGAVVRVRAAAELGARRQAGGPHRVEHDAANGERVLQPVAESDPVPCRHPRAAILRSNGRRCGELRCARRRDRTRDVARL